MAREKTEECPVCGEMFSPQGLAGHVRMAHGVNTVDELRKDGEAAERDEVVRESRQTVGLVDKLAEIGRKRDELKKWSKSNFFQRDEGADECLEALEGLENRIRQRLSDEGIGTQSAQQTVSLERETKQVFNLIDRFAECRAKRAEVEGASLTSTEEATQALDRVERKIREQLAKVSRNQSSTAEA